MRTLRTPEERFVGLPDFAYQPRYCEVDDDEGGTLRMAWIEDGPQGADPVLMLHGEPSWSFLYRRMIPILVAAGHRVVCPDLVGFGRSDKPARREGTREGRWVLLDYVDIVVHIQHEDERNFYALDRLWRDCPLVEVALDDVDPDPSEPS